MINIKNTSVKVNGHWFDYELEDGELLHESEWNGEYYETENGVFRPVYAAEENENSGFDIIGFEKGI